MSEIVTKKYFGDRYQFGLWMHVDNAAPIPVPVQIRIPRLNMADACPTPAIIH